jgi:hypothetical protein
MGVKVRQKEKGKGKPWWVFIAHNGKRASKKIGVSASTVKHIKSCIAGVFNCAVDDDLIPSVATKMQFDRLDGYDFFMHPDAPYKHPAPSGIKKEIEQNVLTL